MKIKRLNLYLYTLYITFFGYMFGPAINFKTGIPRIDNPLTVLFVLIGFVVFFLENGRMLTKIYTMLIALSAMSIWPGIHLGISSLTPTQFMDILFFMVLPAFFYLFYQVLIRDHDPLTRIQRFLIVFALLTAVPPFLEAATGIQFVNASESLTIETGSLKGLFFNPNNLATAAVCLAPAVLFFFTLEGRNTKERLSGWVLYLLLGMSIFASVSRTAIGCYLLISFIYIVYRRKGYITVLLTAFLFGTLALLPSQAIQEFLLSLNGNEFLERFSSRVYLFLYDFSSDNSVSYRQEIYNYFWENPPFLPVGYGPKNFGEYFGGHLSDSLGFQNPHSFIIELYLGFGLVSLAGFVAYVLIYVKNLTFNRYLGSKSRLFGLVAMGIFLLAGFIPSTILRMPFIWLPCLLIFIYSASIKRQALSVQPVRE